MRVYGVIPRSWCRPRARFLYCEVARYMKLPLLVILVMSLAAQIEYKTTNYCHIWHLMWHLIFKYQRLKLCAHIKTRKFQVISFTCITYSIHFYDNLFIEILFYVIISVLLEKMRIGYQWWYFSYRFQRFCCIFELLSIMYFPYMSSWHFCQFNMFTNCSLCKYVITWLPAEMGTNYFDN